MNIFRLLGDFSHLLAIVVLLQKMWRSKSCSGISGKSQVLYSLVFMTRYIDLFTTFISYYNSIMKIFFLTSTFITVYLIYVQYKETYDHASDNFRIELLIIPSFGLALIINHAYYVPEILWTFSIYLEAVAILPQFFLVANTGKAENITFFYLVALGSYRALYLFNWIYRYQTENHYDLIATAAGVVQTYLYCGFFHLYYTKVTKNKNHQLPQDEKLKKPLDKEFQLPEDEKIQIPNDVQLKCPVDDVKLELPL